MMISTVVTPAFLERGADRLPRIAIVGTSHEKAPHPAGKTAWSRAAAVAAESGSEGEFKS
jgi:hypothetical protein